MGGHISFIGRHFRQLLFPLGFEPVKAKTSIATFEAQMSLVENFGLTLMDFLTRVVDKGPDGRSLEAVSLWDRASLIARLLFCYSHSQDKALQWAIVAGAQKVSSAVIKTKRPNPLKQFQRYGAAAFGLLTNDLTKILSSIRADPSSYKALVEFCNLGICVLVLTRWGVWTALLSRAVQLWDFIVDAVSKGTIKTSVVAVGGAAAWDALKIKVKGLLPALSIVISVMRHVTYITNVAGTESIPMAPFALLLTESVINTIRTATAKVLSLAGHTVPSTIFSDPPEPNEAMSPLTLALYFLNGLQNAVYERYPFLVVGASKKHGSIDLCSPVGLRSLASSAAEEVATASLSSAAAAAPAASAADASPLSAPAGEVGESFIGGTIFLSRSGLSNDLFLATALLHPLTMLHVIYRSEYFDRAFEAAAQVLADLLNRDATKRSRAANLSASSSTSSSASSESAVGGAAASASAAGAAEPPVRRFASFAKGPAKAHSASVPVRINASSILPLLMSEVNSIVDAFQDSGLFSSPTRCDFDYPPWLVEHQADYPLYCALYCALSAILISAAISERDNSALSLVIVRRRHQLSSLLAAALATARKSLLRLRALRTDAGELCALSPKGGWPTPARIPGLSSIIFAAESDLFSAGMMVDGAEKAFDVPPAPSPDTISPSQSRLLAKLSELASSCDVSSATAPAVALASDDDKGVTDDAVLEAHAESGGLRFLAHGLGATVAADDDYNSDKDDVAAGEESASGGAGAGASHADDGDEGAGASAAAGDAFMGAAFSGGLGRDNSKHSLRIIQRRAAAAARLQLQAAKAKAPSSISSRVASVPSAAVDEAEPQPKVKHKGGRPAGSKDSYQRAPKGGKGSSTATSEAAPAEAVAAKRKAPSSSATGTAAPTANVSAGASSAAASAPAAEEHDDE